MVRIYSGPDAPHQTIVLLVNSWQDRAGGSLPPGSFEQLLHRGLGGRT